MIKKKAILSFVLIAITVIPFISDSVALTSDEAAEFGPGFHEPGKDWYDSTYQYRISINASNTLAKDTNVTSVPVNFSNYHNATEGVIDIASMQLVKVLENEASVPVPFHVETDAVDIWNAPTLKEIEEDVIETLISENGTCVGTIYNPSEAKHLNVTIRFKTHLSVPSDEVSFQFVYNPDTELNVTSSDYMQFYAGVFENNSFTWGSGVRVYRTQLPDEVAWTEYITLPLEEETSGDVWIEMSAPSLYGNETKYFTLDFSFLDGDGFNEVIHYIPESGIGGGKVQQRNYYPRTQVLQHRDMPYCDIFFPFEGNESGKASYYLYYNFMSGSNHKIIANDAVELTSELDFNARWFNAYFDNGSFFMDKDDQAIDGQINASSVEANETWGVLFGNVINSSDNGKDESNEFTTVISTARVENASTKIEYELYVDGNFLQVNLDSVLPVTLVNTFTNESTTSSFNYMANNTVAFEVNNSVNGTTGTSDSFAFFNEVNDTYLVLLSNETLPYEIVYRGNLDYDVLIESDGSTAFSLQFIVAGSPHNATNQSVILYEKFDALIGFLNRLSSPIITTVSSTKESFQEIEIHYIGDGFIFNFAYDNDVIEVALFGHSLQSLSVNIDNKTGEIPITGTYIIDISALNRSLFERHHAVEITGRNEFGDTVAVTLDLWIANDVIDGIWVLTLMILNPLFLIGGVGVLALLTGAMVKNKKNSKKGCNGEGCNV